ncbi:MAG: amidohydrolase family protein [Firmicutes bacterium]|nr:amidohydrolase family protein [Bacillota bacterium]
MMKVDAHQHFWNLDKVSYPWLGPQHGPIYRTFEAPELEPWIRQAGIDRTVVVQAMNSDQDTEYLLQVAKEYPWIGGIVGWVPLDQPDLAGRRLEELVKNPVFKGVRHLIHEEPDPDWVIRDVVIEGLKVLAAFGIPFDVVAVFPDHLRHVPTLAEKIPNLNMVIDHLAKPPIKDHAMEPWRSQIKSAARYPQVFAKVSGLNTAADWKTWTAEDLRPYIDAALDAFGAERLMFGSDWPVAIQAGDYEKVWVETMRVLGSYSMDEQDAIVGKTAQIFYHLS